MDAGNRQNRSAEVPSSAGFRQKEVRHETQYDPRPGIGRHIGDIDDCASASGGIADDAQLRRPIRGRQFPG
jgi:hypothetical protein